MSTQYSKERDSAHSPHRDEMTLDAVEQLFERLFPPLSRDEPPVDVMARKDDR